MKLIGRKVIITHPDFFGMKGTLVDIKPSNWGFGEKMGHVETMYHFVVVPIEDVAVFIDNGDIME